MKNKSMVIFTPLAGLLTGELPKGVTSRALRLEKPRVRKAKECLIRGFKTGASIIFNDLGARSAGYTPLKWRFSIMFLYRDLIAFGLMLFMAVPAALAGTLHSGQAMQPGQSLVSDDQRHTLILQPDGNVVLYDQNRHALWATNTGSLLKPRDFIMQTDGNLVLYDNSGRPKWASNTSGNPGAFFVVQDDGNLVVYRQGSQTQTANNALWAAASNAPRPTQGRGSPSSSIVVAHMLALVNQQRAAAGLAPLSLNAQLMNAAQGHSQDMASHNFMAHNGSDSSSPFDRMKRAGYNFSVAKENVAAGQATPEQAMSIWMGEVPPNDGHRKNILSPNVHEIGIGYAFNQASRFKHYWTQDFGTRP